MRRLNGLVLVLIIFSLFTCIDPYTPEAFGEEFFLVVEGLVTDGNRQAEVRISRSVSHIDSVPERIDGASVTITDNEGNIYALQGQGEGFYKTMPGFFSAETGRIYTLHFVLGTGEEYVSDPVEMLPVNQIDSVWFVKTEYTGFNQPGTEQGLMITLRTSGASEGSSYYRWKAEETWKYRLVSPKRFEYVSESLIVEIDRPEEFCWKNKVQDDINISSLPAGQGITVEKPVLFISSAKSDRLLLRYSVLISQYSLTREEHEYWDKLKKISESGGTIFDAQPFSIVSNIRNVNNPGEKILGYFSVSALAEKRFYINSNELSGLNLPVYSYDCQQIAKAPQDYPKPNPMSSLPTWDDIVEMHLSTGKYSFTEPLLNPQSGELLKLVFAKIECADCEILGTSAKPDFWTDQDTKNQH